MTVEQTPKQLRVYGTVRVVGFLVHYIEDANAWQLSRCFSGNVPKNNPALERVPCLSILSYSISRGSIGSSDLPHHPHSSRLANGKGYLQSHFTPRQFVDGNIHPIGHVAPLELHQIGCQRFRVACQLAAFGSASQFV